MSGSANVVLNKIPANLQIHGTFAEINSAGGNSKQAYRALIVGNMLPTGSAQSGVPTPSAGLNDAIAQNGRGSMIHLMTRDYRLLDGFGELWYLPMADDAASVAATLTHTVTSAPTAQGTLPYMLAGQQVPVLLTSAMTTVQVAAAWAAAINANLDLPATATASGSAVTITARNKGLCGNDIDVRLAYYGVQGGDVVPAGFAATNVLVGTGTQLTGGSQNPSAAALTVALANLSSTTFDFIAWPYTDAASLNAFQTFMSDSGGRWAWDKMLYGGGFAAYRGTYGAALSFGQSRNDPAMSITPFCDAPEPAWLWAARLTAVCAISLRAHPSVPLQELATGLLPPPIQNQFTDDELNALLNDGMSAVKAIGGQMVTNRMVTTYLTAPSGQSDDSYQDVESRYQLAYALRDLVAYLAKLYARKIWVDEGTRLSGTINNAVAMPSDLRDSCIGRYRYLEGYGVVQNADAFAAAVQVQKVGSAARIYWPGDLANQLRQIEIGVFFVKS